MTPRLCEPSPRRWRERDAIDATARQRDVVDATAWQRDTIDAATETRRPDADFCHMVNVGDDKKDLEEPLSPKEPQEEAIPRGANH